MTDAAGIGGSGRRRHAPCGTAALASIEVVRARERVLERSALPHIALQSRSLAAAAARRSWRCGYGWPVAARAELGNGASVTLPVTEYFAVKPRQRVEAQNEARSGRNTTDGGSLQRRRLSRALLKAATEIARTRRSSGRPRSRRKAARARATRAAWRPSPRSPRRSGTGPGGNRRCRRAARVWRALLAEAQVHGDLTPFLNRVKYRQVEGVAMWLINLVAARPITVFVAACLALLAVFAVLRMPVDIFPNLNLPVIIVAQPYGGMDPAQMEGYLVYYYEYHFLYIAGIEHVESKSIQNVGLVKLYFHPGTDMSQALAQTVSYVDRARAFMPPGTVAPFVVRFDAGTVPVGQLVFSSETRSVGEIQDLALNRVRPTFATLPGVSAPPPFGASQRTVVIRVDPDRLRAMRMSPEEVVRAMPPATRSCPAGISAPATSTGSRSLNSPVPRIQDLEELPDPRRLRRDRVPARYRQRSTTAATS